MHTPAVPRLVCLSLTVQVLRFFLPWGVPHPQIPPPPGHTALAVPHFARLSRLAGCQDDSPAGSALLCPYSETNSSKIETFMLVEYNTVFHIIILYRITVVELTRTDIWRPFGWESNTKYVYGRVSKAWGVPELGVGYPRALYPLYMCMKHC